MSSTYQAGPLARYLSVSFASEPVVIATVEYPFVAEGETYTYQLVASGAPTDWSLITGPSGATVSSSGLVEWPNATPTGSENTFTVTASRGGESDTETWSVKVGELYDTGFVIYMSGIFTVPGCGYPAGAHCFSRVNTLKAKPTGPFYFVGQRSGVTLWAPNGLGCDASIIHFVDNEDVGLDPVPSLYISGSWIVMLYSETAGQTAGSCGTEDPYFDATTGSNEPVDIYLLY